MSEEFEPSETTGRSLVDQVTGLPNALGWRSLLDMEERRCLRYGGNPAVVLVEVRGPLPHRFGAGGPGEEGLARLVADAVAETSRETDAIARVGTRSFTVLAMESGEATGALEERLLRALGRAGIDGAVRARCRSPWGGLPQAWRQLQAMAHSANWRDWEPPRRRAIEGN